MLFLMGRHDPKFSYSLFFEHKLGLRKIFDQGPSTIPMVLFLWSVCSYFHRVLLWSEGDLYRNIRGADS